MFAVAAPSAFWGASAAKAGRGWNACADDDSFRFALGGPLPKDAAGDEAPRQDAQLQARLERLSAGSDARGALRTLRTGAASGIAFVDGGSWVAVSQGQLTLAVTGRSAVGNTHGEDLAWELMEFYRLNCDLLYDDLVDQLQEALQDVAGVYSFVLFDRLRHRVVAARDSSGYGGELYWGLARDGSLMFSSTMDSAMVEVAELDGVQSFPAGAVFVSLVADAYAVFVQQRCPGRLVSFQSPYAWAPAMGDVGSAMCRIISGTDLTKITTSRGYMQRTPSMADIVNDAASMMRGTAH